MTIHNGNCLELLRMLPDNSVDSIVTDPPYGLSFMGKKWDYDVPSVEIWAECLRVLKPGGHMLAFAGTRTQHRMAVRIEDAGFEIRDMIAWVYGSGFPKSLDVSKAIDKLDASDARRERQLRFTNWMRSTGLTGSRIDSITETNMGGHYTTTASQPAVATREHFEKLRPYFKCEVPDWVDQLVDERTVESENFKSREVIGKQKGTLLAVAPGQDNDRSDTTMDITAPATPAAQQWQGWGTALKPALEPITVARKPLTGTVADNVLQYGTGAINIDGCRVATDDGSNRARPPRTPNEILGGGKGTNLTVSEHNDLGRWPANLIHDGSDEVLAAFPNAKGQQGALSGTEPSDKTSNTYGDYETRAASTPRNDSGSAARFFYCPKASKSDRNYGCENLSDTSAADMTNREPDSDGMNSPRAGAGRTSGAKNNHPTVKPIALMRYLCRLVTPPNGVVLDPFTGSGSTGVAATLEGFEFLGAEMDANFHTIATTRVEHARNELGAPTVITIIEYNADNKPTGRYCRMPDVSIELFEDMLPLYGYTGTYSRYVNQLREYNAAGVFCHVYKSSMPGAVGTAVGLDQLLSS